MSGSYEALGALAAAGSTLVTRPVRPSGETIVGARITGVTYTVDASTHLASALETMLDLSGRIENEVFVDAALVNQGSLWTVHTTGNAGSLGAAAAVRAGTVLNGGVIGGVSIGGSMDGLRLEGQADLSNSGIIYAEAGGAGSATGLHTFGISSRPFVPGALTARNLTNNGQISALAPDGTATGVYVELGLASFSNTGSILAEGDVATGLYYVSNTGDGHDLTLNNDGSIVARSTGDLASVGVVFINQDPYFDLTFRNTGLIEGDYAVYGDGGNLSLVNEAAGVLRGVVVLSLNADIFVNHGRVEGDVYLDRGADVFDTSSGTVDGIVNLGLDNDTFIGSAGQDRAVGGAQSDRLEGRGGDDLLLGGTGADYIVGGAGADGLYGEYGDDHLVLEGADRAYGGAGDDVISSGDLSFALIDGGDGFDIWRLPTTAALLDLADARASGRVTGVEALSLQSGAGVAIRFDDVAALGHGSPLKVFGAAGAVTLVGNWINTGARVDAGLSFAAYELNGSTVLVQSGGPQVSVTSSAPSGATGLSPVQSGSAPAPGPATGVSLSQNINYAIDFELPDGGRVPEGEIWASPDGESVLLSIWPALVSIGNDGVIISESSDAPWLQSRWIQAVNVQNARNFDNAGSIYAGAVGNQVSFGVFSTYGRLNNTGNVTTLSEDGGSVGVVTYSGPSDIPVISNSGTVEAYSEGGMASGIVAANSGDIFNSGEVIAEGGAGAVAVGVAAPYAVGEFTHNANFGSVYSGVLTNSGALRAVTTLQDGAPSVGVMIDNFQNVYTIRNDGIIEADIAIKVIGSGGILDVANKGELHGDVVYANSGGKLSLSNSGLIDGDVTMTVPADSALSGDDIRNSGAITGHVSFGDRGDHYEAAGHGSAELVFGNGGNDTLIGADAPDRFDGGAGADLLYGRAGADILRDGGETTNRDFLYGGSGDDTYFVTSSLTGPLDLVYEGGTNPDLAAGASDVDTIRSAGEFFWDYYGVGERLYIDRAAGSQLVGGTNDQQLFGGAGSDQIIGYGGTNRVDAGAGTDAISFGLYGLDESHDGVNTLVMKPGNGLDYVYEFESGVDKIDLTAFHFGITGQQVLDQAVNVDNPGTADDYCYFYLTSAGGVDNYVAFIGLLSNQLQAGDFIT